MTPILTQPTHQSGHIEFSLAEMGNQQMKAGTIRFRLSSCQPKHEQDKQLSLVFHFFQTAGRIFGIQSVFDTDLSLVLAKKPRIAGLFAIGSGRLS